VFFGGILHIVLRTIILCSDLRQKYLPCNAEIVLGSPDQTEFTGRLLM